MGDDHGEDIPLGEQEEQTHQKAHRTGHDHAKPALSEIVQQAERDRDKRRSDHASQLPITQRALDVVHHEAAEQDFFTDGGIDPHQHHRHRKGDVQVRPGHQVHAHFLLKAQGLREHDHRNDHHHDERGSQEPLQRGQPDAARTFDPERGKSFAGHDHIDHYAKGEEAGGQAGQGQVVAAGTIVVEHEADGSPDDKKSENEKPGGQQSLCQAVQTRGSFRIVRLRPHWEDLRL